MDWQFRQIRNYGPADPRFLDATDFEKELEIWTWVHDKKKARGDAEEGDPIARVATDDGVSVRTIRHGVYSTRAATDPASLEAAQEAIRAGRLPNESDEAVGLRIVAAAAAAVPAGPSEDEAAEARRVLAELGLHYERQ